MKTINIGKVSLFVALLAISAQLKIPLGIISITFQTLVVYLCGLLLKRNEAFMSIIVYIIAGLIGLPVFASGGGLSYIASPSFGYLIGFLVAAVFIASFKKKFHPFVCCLIATGIIYLFGISYFILIQHFVYNLNYEFTWIINSLFLIFLPGDLLSCYIATLITKRLKVKNI